jgi:hypothetical protein
MVSVMVTLLMASNPVAELLNTKGYVLVVKSNVYK